jgi:hypothetical protein
MDEFNSTVNGILDPVFDNDFILGTLRVFLVLYGGLAAPKLPLSWSPYFANTYTRILVMIFIIWIFNKDPTVAVLVAVGYYLSIHYLLNAGLQWASQTGIVPQELSSLISGGGGPTIKPSSVIQAEAALMQESLAASKATGYVTPPEAVVSGPVSTGAVAGIPTIPSGTAANVPSMMATDPKGGVPVAFTPDHIYDLAVAPR